MKVLCVDGGWVGNLMHYLQKGISEIGGEVKYVSFKEKFSLSRKLQLHQITRIRSWDDHKQLSQFNLEVLNIADDFKPDILFVFNESRLFTDTIIKIKQRTKCGIACFLADNPFDSMRFKYLPLSLPYFDVIFYGEKIWFQNLQNVAPNCHYHFIIEGFDPDTFFPARNEAISNDEKAKLSCDLSFTGSAYGDKAEGGYRAGILGQLDGFSMKIFGSDGWDKKFKYFPVIERAYMGERLSFDELRKLYRLSKINLNIPNPQVFTSFQSRVFEIAACKGFQLIDYRTELDNYFTDNEIVTYKSIGELKEKARYFINHENERQEYIDKLYKIVLERHTWKIRADEFFEVLKNVF